jgi:hypothetical protein
MPRRVACKSGMRTGRLEHNDVHRLLAGCFGEENRHHQDNRSADPPPGIAAAVRGRRVRFCVGGFADDLARRAGGQPGRRRLRPRVAPVDPARPVGTRHFI